MAFDLIGYFEALNFAREVHEKQKRGNGDPYIFHCIRVSQIILLLKDLQPDIYALRDKLAIAAVLHDCIEDSDDPALEEKMIDQKFGSFVCALVKELTIPKDPAFTYKQQRQKMIEHCGSLSHQAQILKLADRLDNMSELHSMGDRFKKRYCEETPLMLANMKGACPELEERISGILAPYQALFREEKP